MLLRSKNLKLQRQSRLLLQRMREQYRLRKQQAPQEEKGKERSLSESAQEESKGGKSAENGAEPGKEEGARENADAPVISPQERQRIADEVRKMLASDKLFAPDLNLTRMAQMANCHAKTLSRVIHLEFGCGFPALINKAALWRPAKELNPLNMSAIRWPE